MRLMVSRESLRRVLRSTECLLLAGATLVLVQNDIVTTLQGEYSYRVVSTKIIRG
jgi:hypothetical protein